MNVTFSLIYDSFYIKDLRQIAWHSAPHISHVFFFFFSPSDLSSLCCEKFWRSSQC